MNQLTPDWINLTRPSCCKAFQPDAFLVLHPVKAPLHPILQRLRRVHRLRKSIEKWSKVEKCVGNKTSMLERHVSSFLSLGELLYLMSSWACSKTPGPPMSINKKVHNMYRMFQELFIYPSLVFFCLDPYAHGCLTAPNKIVDSATCEIVKLTKNSSEISVFMEIQLTPRKGDAAGIDDWDLFRFALGSSLR